MVLKAAASVTQERSRRRTRSRHPGSATWLTPSRAQSHRRARHRDHKRAQSIPTSSGQSVSSRRSAHPVAQDVDYLWANGVPDPAAAHQQAIICARQDREHQGGAAASANLCGDRVCW